MAKELSSPELKRESGQMEFGEFLVVESPIVVSACKFTGPGEVRPCPWISKLKKGTVALLFSMQNLFQNLQLTPLLVGGKLLELFLWNTPSRQRPLRRPAHPGQPYPACGSGPCPWSNYH